MPDIQSLIRQYQNPDGSLRVNELILLLTRYVEQKERIAILEEENRDLREVVNPRPRTPWQQGRHLRTL